MQVRSMFSEEEIKILRGLQSNVLSTKSRLLRKHKKYLENNNDAIDFICRFPRILQIETIASCNARCIMCPTPWTKRKRRKVIDDKLFKKIINDCIDLKPIMIWPYLNGEPFLDPKIFDRLDYIEKTIPGQQMGIFTNASLLNEDKIRKLFEYNMKLLHVSINAASEDIYKKVMGLDYKKLQNNMELILKYNKNTFIEVSLVRLVENREEIDKFKEIWKDVVNIVEIHPSSNWGGQFEVKADRYKNQINRIKSLVRPPKPCYWRLINMFVMSDGKVIHCCSDSEGRLVIGDAKDESLSQIWHNGFNKVLRYKHLFGSHKKDIDICRNCTDTY